MVLGFWFLSTTQKQNISLQWKRLKSPTEKECKCQNQMPNMLKLRSDINEITHYEFVLQNSQQTFFIVTHLS